MSNPPNAPDLAQELARRHERQTTRVTALLHCHGRFQTVRIVDFSLGGLQLEKCFGIALADRVAVELLSGQRLEGKVVWVIAARVGVKFRHPLAPDDPVVALLSKAASRTQDPKTAPAQDLPSKLS